MYCKWFPLIKLRRLLSIILIMLLLKFILLSSSLVVPWSLPNIYEIKEFWCQVWRGAFEGGKPICLGRKSHGRVLLCPAGSTTGREWKMYLPAQQTNKNALNFFNGSFQPELKVFPHWNKNQNHLKYIFGVKTGSGWEGWEDVSESVYSPLIPSVSSSTQGAWVQQEESICRNIETLGILTVALNLWTLWNNYLLWLHHL